MVERNNEIKFEIIEHLGVLDKYPTGWSKEVNLVSWNGAPPKVDIRDWDESHERMSKGITLHVPEAQKLRDVLNDRTLIDLEKYDIER